MKTTKDYFDGWCSYYEKSFGHSYKMNSNADYKQGFEDAKTNNRHLLRLKKQIQLYKSINK